MTLTIEEKAFNSANRFIVALDGPSASGKGHIGSLIAQEFTLTYISSGIVYRGLAYVCLQKNIAADDKTAIVELSQNTDIIPIIKDVDLSVEIIGDFASKISALPEVRQNLGVYLKKLIKTTPRIIMEGRDIGTVIAPNADLKIFITASLEVRAMRRYKQLLLAEKDCMLSDVLDRLRERDERDISRNVAPLLPAKDAYIIDTTNLAPSEVIQKIKAYIVGRSTQ